MRRIPLTLILVGLIVSTGHIHADEKTGDKATDAEGKPKTVYTEKSKVERVKAERDKTVSTSKYKDKTAKTSKHKTSKHKTSQHKPSQRKPSQRKEKLSKQHTQKAGSYKQKSAKHVERRDGKQKAKHGNATAAVKRTERNDRKALKEDYKTKVANEGERVKGKKPWWKFWASREG